MRRKIFFDLDGTLIDSSKRMYNLFCTLNTNCKMSYNEYWDIKKQGHSQKQMLTNYYNYSNEMCEIFHKEWMENIENQSLLLLDTPFKDAIETLKKLSRKNDLFIVTARQNKNLTIKQITNFKLIDYSKDVLITEQKVKKEKIIMQNIDSLNINDIIIGDTKEDVDAGLALNIKKFGITTGMLNYNKLLMYKPDNIYNSLKEFCANVC